MVRLKDDEAEEDDSTGAVGSVAKAEAEAEAEAEPHTKGKLTVKNLAYQGTKNVTLAKNSDNAFKIRFEKLKSKQAYGTKQSIADVANTILAGGKKKNAKAMFSYKREGTSLPGQVEEDGATADSSGLATVTFQGVEDNLDN